LIFSLDKRLFSSLYIIQYPGYASDRDFFCSVLLMLPVAGNMIFFRPGCMGTIKHCTDELIFERLKIIDVSAIGLREAARPGGPPVYST